MKKQLTYSIITVLAIVILVSGSTYAYFTSSFSSNNLSTETKQLSVIYSGGTPINGPINMVSSKSTGFSTEINMAVRDGSVEPNINLYINIDNITENLAIPGLIWEVCSKRGNETEICQSGNFDGYNASNNNKVIIVNNYKLTTVNTKFTVYIWLDGAQVDNDVIGGSFSGYIAAEGENFTAKFT